MDKGYQIRLANSGDIDDLNTLLKRSTAIWNRSEKEVNGLVDLLRMTKDSLDDSICYTAQTQGNLIGFFYVSHNNDENGLNPARLYVAPDFIKKGVGSNLWHKVIDEIKVSIKTLKFLSEPNAVGFYIKKGGYIIGEKACKITPGLMLPIIQFDLKNR
ncbi:MAG: GNAT family N-acetyltransferase [Rickettsiales bacterium]|nr:GNAT family N-acetyltransferase [Rickettsiales bacterium]MCA0254042.1 GNAT family N-acetyltransferase [Pseudomonadota bacterium]